MARTTTRTKVVKPTLRPPLLRWHRLIDQRPVVGEGKGTPALGTMKKTRPAIVHKPRAK
jgi:hypothetical protein